MEYASDREEGENNECLCEEGFYWNETKKLCIVNCSLPSYSIGSNQSSIDSCLCSNPDKFVWNLTEVECVIDCSDKVNYATERIENSLDECLCE